MEDTIDLEIDTRELEAALLKLSKRMAGEVMRESLQAGGNVLLDAVVTHTPERTDELTPEQTSLPPGILKADMHTEIQISRKFDSARIKIGPSKEIGGLVAYRQENGWTLTGHGKRARKIRDIPGKHFMAAAFDEAAENAVETFLGVLENALGYGENALPEDNYGGEYY